MHGSNQKFLNNLTNWKWEQVSKIPENLQKSYENHGNVRKFLITWKVLMWKMNNMSSYGINLKEKLKQNVVYLLCKCNNTFRCISKLQRHHEFSCFMHHAQEWRITFQCTLCFYHWFTVKLTRPSWFISTVITQQSKCVLESISPFHINTLL